MAKITVKTDCENAPKKALLRDFTAAFINGDKEFILNNMSEDIVWTQVGDKVIDGKKAAEESLKDMLDGSITELIIENIITHGDTGAVNGMMTMNGESEFGFCDVYNFSDHSKDAKIKQITSYIIEEKADK